MPPSAMPPTPPIMNLTPPALVNGNVFMPLIFTSVQMDMELSYIVEELEEILTEVQGYVSPVRLGAHGPALFCVNALVVTFVKYLQNLLGEVRQLDVASMIRHVRVVHDGLGLFACADINDDALRAERMDMFGVFMRSRWMMDETTFRAILSNHYATLPGPPVRTHSAAFPTDSQVRNMRRRLFETPPRLPGLSPASTIMSVHDTPGSATNPIEIADVETESEVIDMTGVAD